MEQMLQVGVISSTHGVRGEMKVFPTTDDIQRFKKLKEVILDTGKEYKTLNIQSVKFFKNMVILKFKEFDNINDIEIYKGKSLYVTRQNAVKLQKDEYFIADLIGMHAVSEDGTLKGTIEDVIETGANDVYAIRLEDGRELLLPAIKQCVLEINMEEQILTFHLLEGLLS